ncbi:MAG: AbrB/MazE/SpoVT family DNA-binding domain-containing protein [Methylotenera sp.]|nr:AbrB/MazE/SpoVT family DNA-binding domain-containing protein [Methylotenera sp.]
MKLNIQKWGNSAAIRLPESILEQLDVKIGDSIEVNVQANIVTIRASKPKYKLADLLAQSHEGPPVVDCWENMLPVGKEIY